MACFQWRPVSPHLPTDSFMLAIAKSANIGQGECKTTQLNHVVNQLITELATPFDIVAQDGSNKSCQAFILYFTCDNLACTLKYSYLYNYLMYPSCSSSSTGWIL